MPSCRHLDLEVHRYFFKHAEKFTTPRFKFGLNPPLIDGILNVLSYELVS